MTGSRPEEQTQTIEWSLWLQWVLATTVGWAIGFTLAGEIGIGAVIGLAQWLVLRQLLYQAGWWIWASTVGWAIGWTMIVTGVLLPPDSGIVGSVVAGLVFGILVGVAQWFYLRRQVHEAGWWVIASVAGWSIGLTGIFGVTMVGAIVGAVTGFALVGLLPTARLEEEDPS
jgi:uncharacterized membrane protein